MIRWIKRLFRRKPERQISPADMEEAISRGQKRLAEEMKKSYFAESPLTKAINVRPE